MSAVTELLGEVPFFQLLDETERERLAEHLEVVKLSAGAMIFEYGEPGDSLFVIRSGTVEIFFRDDTGSRILLETASSGDFFGELSLLDGGPRSASAQATSELEALRLKRGALDDFIRRHPSAALDLLAATGRRLRQTAERLRHTASRNVNVEVEDKRTTVQKAADWIAEFSGSIAFLMIHVGWFFFWILANSGMIPGLPVLDPFPFGLLTMIVSLEAIMLSVFVLLSQNRQAEKDHVRSDIEYDVNLKAELEIAHLHEKVDRLHFEMLSGLEQVSRSLGVRPKDRLEKT
jgi:uncharacterized membrane protein